MDFKLILGCCLAAALCSCRRSAGPDSSAVLHGLTPVTVTHPIRGTLSETIDLNAVSAFLIKTDVKSDISGYIQKVDIKPGQKVDQGQELFTIRSKEAQHLGNAISRLDTSFRFTGLVVVTSPVAGYVGPLTKAVNDYIQEGDVLVTVSDLNNLVFILELPYELKPYLPANKTVTLTLPDKQVLQGTLTLSIPSVDPVAQTQSYVIHVPGASGIPENLIAVVTFVKKSKPGVVMLPRDAVLTNEVQSEFWIMKMTDSTTAVKVPVVKGLETSGKVEIISPLLAPDDLILLSGNYGLPDTARVIIQDRQ
jgi:multidrug efflux pump subunit AcrA (membrane-fusion protein)